MLHRDDSPPTDVAGIQHSGFCARGPKAVWPVADATRRVDHAFLFVRATGRRSDDLRFSDRGDGRPMGLSSILGDDAQL
jgi:hypothetical protein